MKNIRSLLLLASLPLAALTLAAQSATDDETLPPPPPPGAEAPHGQRPPPPPLVGVLDANHDGVISADEIANAPAALRTLDKNGDGQLTPDEFHPPRRGPRPARHAKAAAPRPPSSR